MKTLTREARGFIEGVTKYIQSEKSNKDVSPKVQSFFTKVTEQAKKEQIAHIQSAVTLTAEEKALIEQALVRLLGHTIEPVYTTDSAVLGGIKIRVADWVVDTSLQTQLNNLATSLATV